MLVLKPFDGASTDASHEIDVSDYMTGAVTVAANTGSPDGTVTIYDTSPGNDLIAVATYATPSAPRKWSGPVFSKLTIVLSGNTTGTIDVWVELKP